jgi:single-strand DNA-binding protein
MNEQPRDAGDNHVLLRGLLAVEPRTRILTSGDELCWFRLTVPRPRSSYGRARADSIDCSTVRATARRVLTRCSAGERIEVSGSLRRRFWRSAAGAAASRYEVEVVNVRRLRLHSDPEPKGDTPGQEPRSQAPG